MIDLQRLKTDLLALGLLAVALFVALSLASFDPSDPPSTSVLPLRVHPINLCGTAGATIALRMRELLGLGAWCALLTLIAWDLRLFSRQDDGSPRTWLAAVGSVLAVTGCCVALHVTNPGFLSASEAGSGGYVGAWLGTLLLDHVALPGIVLLTIGMVVAGIMLSPAATVFATSGRVVGGPLTMLSSFATAVQATIARHRERRAAKAAKAADEVVESEWETASSDEDEGDEEEEFPVIERKPRAFTVNPPTLPQALPPRRKPSTAESEYELPTPDILDDAEEFPYELLAKKAQLSAETLERSFREFGLNVRVVAIDTGPVITQFELELEPGLRLNKITSLADDLAIALRVPSVRVVAPIPGKNTVGIEVPNEKRVMVRLRELMESAEETEKARIPLFLGKDVSGRPLVVDMTRMPHLLIAGRTGTGKSVCLNTLILSMLMTRTPDEVRMLMIDPKMVELSPYKSVPHLMHPVITDMKKAEAVLAWAVDKMEERYDLLARCGVRHLDSYNKLGREKILDRLGLDEDGEEAEGVPEKMPYIVIVADEMADMMMTCGKDVEAHIVRLAQKSRAVGIHLVLATQKPTVDVVTGLIKSNLPARIAFQVASRMDSRVVLDEMGADKLLGNGDMLYLAPGTSNVTRAQGTFVSDDEVNTVIDFYSDYDAQYSEELARLNTSGGSGGGGIDSSRLSDDMYLPAIDVVVREGRGSVSLLQRCLGIGYGRAARLIDYMAEDGIVGDYNGSQAREVLYSPEQWEAAKENFG